MDKLDDDIIWDDDDGEINLDEIPDYRAAIVKGTLTVVAWYPSLAYGGPLGNLLREAQLRGVAVADLIITGEDPGERELFVRFLSAGRNRDEAEGVLLEWAATLGYRRVWLPDRLVELEPNPDQIGTASVECPTCGVQWADASPEFWLDMRRSGVFPSTCTVCGALLPQWTVAAAETSACVGSGAATLRPGSAEPTSDRTAPIITVCFFQESS